MRAVYISSALLLLLLAGTCLGATPAHAQNATWLATPGSGDFNTDANWTPATVPTGIATFGPSNTTTLGLSAGVAVSTMMFNGGAPAYTFNSFGNFLELDGAGIVNVSSNVPTLNVTFSGMLFSNSASAGNAIVNNTGGITFTDFSTAGTAAITTSSGGFLLSFTDTTSAGSAMITTDSGSLTQFTTNSTGGNAQLITNAGGKVDFAGTAGPNANNKFTAGSIAGAGSYFLGGGELTVGSNGLSTTVSGVIADGASSGGGDTGASLVKVGNGRLTLGGANTYSGPTTVNAGTLAVTGSIASPTTVNAGGILGGTGTITTATLNANGTLAPGLSVGTLNTGSLTFSSGSVLAVEIDGTGSDRLNVTGTVSLGGATLSVSSLGGYVHTPGTVYTIVANDGTEPVSGRFSGLPEGATVSGGGFFFKISYGGGDGNEVTLEALAVPAPTLSEWAQFGLTLVLAGIAVWYLRRRRGFGPA